MFSSVIDLNEFEYPTSSNHQNVKYLYRFRLDDGTADKNPSFEHFASIYENYTRFSFSSSSSKLLTNVLTFRFSLFTLEKTQCRGVDLQAKSSSINRYDEQIGVALKGDNLGRMLALRTCSNVERLADEMIFYGLIRFEFCSKNLSSIECQCERRFRNDENHQYVLSLSHRLLPKQRLDLISLMQNDLKHFSSQLVDSAIDFRSKLRTSSSNSSIGTRRTNSNSDEIDLPLKISCSIDGLRRKKSASLNSPANSVENRPTAEELERRELPWCWRSYSVC